MLSHSVVANSSQSHGLQPSRLLCPWNLLDKNAQVGCHFLLHGYIQEHALLSFLWTIVREPGSHFFPCNIPNKANKSLLQSWVHLECKKQTEWKQLCLQCNHRQGYTNRVTVRKQEASCMERTWELSPACLHLTSDSSLYIQRETQ